MISVSDLLLTDFPASSCLALKDTCGDAGNGVYWLRAPKSGKAYQAYCDMERGGYEVVGRQYKALPHGQQVWKNVGNHPNVGLSNFNMREEGLGRYLRWHVYKALISAI